MNIIQQARTVGAVALSFLPISLAGATLPKAPIDPQGTQKSGIVLKQTKEKKNTTKISTVRFLAVQDSPLEPIQIYQVPKNLDARQIEALINSDGKRKNWFGCSSASSTEEAIKEAHSAGFGPRLIVFQLTENSPLKVAPVKRNLTGSQIEEQLNFKNRNWYNWYGTDTANSPCEAIAEAKKAGFGVTG